MGMATGVKTSKRPPRKPRTAEQKVATIAFPALAEEHLDVSTLETWLWDAACAVRGAADAPKFKDFILPLVFFKRLSDVFDDEFVGQVRECGTKTTMTSHCMKTTAGSGLRLVRPRHPWRVEPTMNASWQYRFCPIDVPQD